MNQDQVNEAVENAARQAARAVNKEGTITFKVDPFYAEARDAKTARQWAETLDRALGVNAWSQQQAAQAALEAFRGRAHTWAQTRDKQGGNVKTAMERWDTMRVPFLERFEVDKTPADKLSLLSNLRMAANESEEDFFDRTNYAMLTCTDEEKATITDQRTRLQCFEMCRDTITQLLYMNGLPLDVRRVVEQGRPDAGYTLDQCHKAAVKAGRARRPQAAATQIAGVEMTSAADPSSDEGMKQQIAALQRAYAAKQGGATGGATPRRNAPRKAPSGGGGAAKSGDKPKGNGWMAAQKALAMHLREWINCFKCKQWGQHFSDECCLSAAQIATLTPQDRYVKPTGQPSDKQFPN